MYDGAFDCVGVLDHSGVVAESYAYTYEGAVTITGCAGGTISSTAVGWHQGYGRMHRDDESGSNYAVHRYYDESLGRFMTEDPAGRWHDSSNVGNGNAWIGSAYRNGWDPLGLQSRCCGKGYAIVIHDQQMFSTNVGMPRRIFNVGGNSAAAAAVNRISAAAKKAGYDIKTYTFSSEGGGKKHKARVTPASEDEGARDEAIRAAKTDPCFKGFVFVGHGLNDGRLNLIVNVTGRALGNQVFGAAQLNERLDHQLDFVCVLACGTDRAEGDWGANVGDDGTVVTSPDGMPFVSVPFVTDVGDRADTAVDGIRGR
jgi:RHS repeat-associated protein